jgi:hypothetical protein
MFEIIHLSSSRIHRGSGVALLMVLLIVVAITILATGFLASTDTELACGANTLLRVQMDQLAQSGVEHAKGLLLHPQEVSSTCWPGAAAQQLVTPSSDYYDVTVVRDANESTNYCTYNIACDAYRRKDTEKTGESRLWAQLRLDPCIALWIGTATTTTTLWNGLTVHGDVYSGDGLVNQGTINGDVFAASLIGTGTKTGQLRLPQTLPLAWPTLAVADFTSRYSYGPLSGQTFGPYDPPRVCYRWGDLTLSGSTQINGMLLVQGNLTVRGINNVITAGKNLPALYVTGNLTVEKGASLTITGLAAAEKNIRIGDNTTVSVLGGLFGSRGLVQVQTADDQSGNGNAVTLYSTPVWQPAGGRVGGALLFDGIDDYGQTENSSRLQVTDDYTYTLSLWIKPNGTQNSWAGIISKTDPSSMENHWTLRFNSDSEKKLVIYHPTGAWDTGITLTQVADVWHHIVIVRSSLGIASYLDPVGSSPPSWKTESWTTLPGRGNGHLNIGVDRTASISRVYGGLLDDIRIYSRALGASEVSSPVSSTALIGYWTFDEHAPSVTITAEPMKAAIVVWPSGTRTQWSPAAGGFFKSIRRWEP